MISENLYFGESEVRLLRSLKGSHWEYYGIPLSKPQPDYALVDLVIRTDTNVLGIHADDGIDASYGYSWLMIDTDNWGENDAIAAGGAFSFYRGERVSGVELVRHSRTWISADGSPFQWKQDVGIIFTLESGKFSVVKSNWFDLDFDIQRHPFSADWAIRQPYVSPQAEIDDEVAVAMEFISI